MASHRHGGTRLPSLGALLVAMVLVVGACSDGSPGTSGTSGPGTSGPGTSGPASTSTSPPPSTGSGPLPLGSYTATGAGQGCLPGASECQAFEVDCGNLGRPARGEIDIRRATGQARGVVMVFSASNGGMWYTEQNPNAAAFIDDLRSDGFTVVQVVWRRGSWLTAQPGERAGTARVACRPATVIRWVHDNHYAPLGVDPAPLECGFCLTGNSGGASQAVYALAYYGLDTIVDAVVATSGPPHASQSKGCLRNPGEEEYWYTTESQLSNIDEPYGFGGRNGAGGPCEAGDASFVSTWASDSVATGARDLVHPQTRMHFVLGGADDTPAPAHARDYVAALEAAGSPQVTVELEATMPHGLNQAGLDLIRRALTGS